jgi:hypothetical protein
MSTLVVLGLLCAAPMSAGATWMRRRRVALRAWEDELATAFARDKALLPLSRSTLRATRGEPTSGTQ